MVRWLRLSVVLGCLSLGCSAAPPGPRGPLSVAGVGFGGDEVVGFSHARFERPGEPVFRGVSDYYVSRFSLLLRRLEVRLAPVSWADIGGDFGFIDAGADVRFGLPAREERFMAFNLALGLRSGKGLPIKATRGAHSYWGRLEAYPRLGSMPGRSGAVFRGVVAVGVNAGVFYHELDARPLSSDMDSESWEWTGVQLLRREVRLEGALGFHQMTRRGISFLVAVEPYWVAKAWTPSVEPSAIACATCFEYRQQYGVVLVLSGAYFLPFESRDARSN